MLMNNDHFVTFDNWNSNDQSIHDNLHGCTYNYRHIVCYNYIKLFFKCIINKILTGILLHHYIYKL